jgi:hypothetical protein
MGKRRKEQEKEYKENVGKRGGTLREGRNKKKNTEKWKEQDEEHK